MTEIKTTISIEGKSLEGFEAVSLTQSINDHHHFDVTLDMEVIEKFGTHTLDASKDWLGKSIIITFGKKEFLGTIVNIQVVHNDGFNGQIVISGYSQTILLEGGAHVQSWLKKDLTSIVKEVTQAGGVDADVKPVYKKPFEYQAQYGETHFQFLQRLAKQHNEWFYYDGAKLIFGKPDLEAPVELQYGGDVHSISVSIEAITSKQNHFTYNPLEDKKEESKTKDKVGGLSELGDFAFNKSKELFGIVPNAFSKARVEDKNEIDTIVKNKQGSAVAKSNVLRASSSKLGLTVGTVIKVSASMLDAGSTSFKNYGEYIITNISHSATGINSYMNHFEAIGSGVEFLPEPNVEMPSAQSQLATVLSNEDPKKKGRVEVQFQWQTGEMKTAWIRVLSPDAGKSDKVGVNRGFVFIPEKDDQVMVGFRYNDPNRPFVLGSMFSGTTGAGGDADNKAKSITTRSGSTIVFDDDANDGSITIIDAAQNSMSFDGKGAISITANDIISLSVGKSTLVMDKDGNIMLKGETISVKGEKEIGIVASKGEGEGSAVHLVPDEATVAGKDNIILAGSKSASLASDDTTVSGKTKVDVAGGKINLN